MFPINPSECTANLRVEGCGSPSESSRLVREPVDSSSHAHKLSRKRLTSTGGYGKYQIIIRGNFLEDVCLTRKERKVLIGVNA